MPNPRTQFTDLPLELRELVWEHALPSPRVFQVKRIHLTRPDVISKRLLSIVFSPHSAAGGSTNVGAYRMFRCFEFNRKYPPPVITQVCRESRAVAMRAGYFLLPTAFSGETPRTVGDFRYGVVWFGAAVDFLYFSFPLKHDTFEYGWGYRPYPTPGLSLIQNVGVEWVYLFQDAQAPPQKWASRRMARHWMGHVLPLFEIPAARKQLWVVVPVARNMNTEDALGREPAGSFDIEAHFSPMPELTQIPLHAGDYAWVDVRHAIRRALRRPETKQRSFELFGDGAWYLPDLRLCMISRVGASGGRMIQPSHGLRARLLSWFRLTR